MVLILVGLIVSISLLVYGKFFNLIGLQWIGTRLVSIAEHIWGFLNAESE